MRVDLFCNIAVLIHIRCCLLYTSQFYQFINALIAVSVFPFLALPLMITIFMRVSSNFRFEMCIRDRKKRKIQFVQQEQYMKYVVSEVWCTMKLKFMLGWHLFFCVHISNSRIFSYQIVIQLSLIHIWYFQTGLYCSNRNCMLFYFKKQNSAIFIMGSESKHKSWCT